MGNPATSPLTRLYQLIERGHITKAIEWRGSHYVLRSLNDEEYAWRDSFYNMDSAVMAMFSAQRSPTLAIATVSIDGVLVEAIPELKLTEEEDKLVAAGAGSRKFIVASKLRRIYSDMPRDYVAGLFDLYMKEVEVPSRKIGEDDLKNS